MYTSSGYNAHTAHSSGGDVRELYSVAEAQGGYFSAAQALAAGYSRPSLAYHFRIGTFTRAGSGVYRLAMFPATQHEDLYVAWLKAGPKAVVSHDSALSLYGLSDVLPSEVHLTLPRTSSRRREGIRMHTSHLAADEVTVRDGLPVTTVARTIADVARTGLASELVAQAIDEALSRGLLSRSQLQEQAQASGGRTHELVMRALRTKESE